MSGIKSIIFLVIGLFLAKSLLNLINIKSRRRSLARRFGCKPGKAYEQPDKRLGLLFLYQNIRNFQAHTFLQSWEQYLQENGKTFEFWILGQRMLVTSDPDNLKTILTTSFHDFEKGPQVRAAFASLTGNGIFAVDGKEWHEARALLRPSFAKSEMNDTQLFETHCQCFLQMLPADGVAIDLQELLSHLTMDTATDLLFGSSTGSLAMSGDSEARRFSSAADIALNAVWRDVSVKSLSRLLDRQDSKSAREYLHKTVDHYVQKALKKRPEGFKGVHPRAEIDKGRRYVFLEHLTESTKDADTLRDQSLSALFGGRETTASLLSNLLYVLARRPDVWGKLRTEALHLCDQSLDQETMKKAPYLSQCVSECK